MNYEFTPTEAEKGGTLLYISQYLKYKNRPDLNISQAKELNSSVIEVENKNIKNSIVRCIYKHSNMSITEFISDFLESLLVKMSLEKKEVAFLRDLLTCDSNNNTHDFLELMFSFSFLPTIIKPTWITLRSQPLIDNISINELHSNIVADNVTTDISDHLTQFVAIPGDWHTEIFSQDIYRRNYKNLNSDKFKQNLNKINRTTLFSDKNVDDAYDSFLDETKKSH